jgi:hypothetical protein
MSLLMPQPGEKQKNVSHGTVNMKTQFDKKHGVRPRKFNREDRVSVKVHSGNKWSWQPGKVISRKGEVCYYVEIAGKIKIFHANQMMLNLTPNREEEWLKVMEEVFDLNCTPVGQKKNEEASKLEDVEHSAPERRFVEDAKSTTAEEDSKKMTPKKQPSPPRSASPGTKIDERSKEKPKSVKWWVRLTGSPAKNVRRSTRISRAPARFSPADYEPTKQPKVVRFANTITCKYYNPKSVPRDIKLDRHMESTKKTEDDFNKKTTKELKKTTPEEKGRKQFEKKGRCWNGNNNENNCIVHVKPRRGHSEYRTRNCL